MKKKEMNQDEKYISGIFNYCDRWCERCQMTDKCRVYADNERKKAKHIREGKDPDDWKVVMQDVKEDFEEALLLLQKAAEEEGIDLDDLPPSDYKEPDPSGHQLNTLAGDYMRAAHDFLKKFHQAIEAESRDLSDRIEIIPSPHDELESFKQIGASYEIISWYHTLIPAKIHRALSSRMEAGMREGSEFAQISQDDADGSAKVAHEGLVKSIMALQGIYKWHESLQNDALELMIKADSMRKRIDAGFPGHHCFKRPGLDSKRFSSE